MTTDPLPRLAPPRPLPPRLSLRAIALAFLLLAAVPLAGASPDSAQWSQERREVTAATVGGGFQVRSERDAGGAQDVLVAGYDARAARLGMTLDAQEPDRTAMASALTLLAAYEFRDGDVDGLYDPGEEVVRRIVIPGTPAVSSVQDLPDGGWRATSVHALPAPAAQSSMLPVDVLAQAATPGRLQVQVEAHPRATGGLDPTAFAVSFRLIDAATNGTHMALEVAVDSTTQHDALSADLARLSDDGYALATRWENAGQGEVLAGNDPLSATFVRSRPAGSDVAFPATMAAAWAPGGADGVLERVPGGSLPVYLGTALVAAAAFALPAWRRLKAA